MQPRPGDQPVLLVTNQSSSCRLVTRTLFVTNQSSSCRLVTRQTFFVGWSRGHCSRSTKSQGRLVTRSAPSVTKGGWNPEPVAWQPCPSILPDTRWHMQPWAFASAARADLPSRLRVGGSADNRQIGGFSASHTGVGWSAESPTDAMRHASCVRERSACTVVPGGSAVQPTISL